MERYLLWMARLPESTGSEEVVGALKDVVLAAPELIKLVTLPLSPVRGTALVLKVPVERQSEFNRILKTLNLEELQR